MVMLNKKMQKTQVFLKCNHKYVQKKLRYTRRLRKKKREERGKKNHFSLGFLQELCCVAPPSYPPNSSDLRHLHRRPMAAECVFATLCGEAWTAHALLQDQEPTGAASASDAQAVPRSGLCSGRVLPF